MSGIHSQHANERSGCFELGQVEIAGTGGVGGALMILLGLSGTMALVVVAVVVTSC